MPQSSLSSSFSLIQIPNSPLFPCNTVQWPLALSRCPSRRHPNSSFAPFRGTVTSIGSLFFFFRNGTIGFFKATVTYSTVHSIYHSISMSTTTRSGPRQKARLFNLFLARRMDHSCFTMDSSHEWYRMANGGSCFWPREAKW